MCITLRRVDVKTIFLWLSIVGVGSLTLIGCPFSMESMNNKLLMKNNSNTEVVTLLNVSYPDSSLAKAAIDHYFSPKSQLHIGNFYDLEDYPGLTVFVFEHAYFKSRWNEGVGRPDTYLAEDKILKRWVLSKHELDSLGWVLRYP